MINLLMFVSFYRPHITLTMSRPTVISLFSSIVLGMLVGSQKYQGMQHLLWASLRTFMNMDLILTPCEVYSLVRGKETDLWHKLNNLPNGETSELWSRDFKRRPLALCSVLLTVSCSLCLSVELMGSMKHWHILHGKLVPLCLATRKNLTFSYVLLENKFIK